MEHKNLINARKAKGFTQKQIAEKIAMEQTTYSKKERGVSPIREEEWLRFAKILDVAVEDIKDGNHLLHLNGFLSKSRSNDGQMIAVPEDMLNIIIKYNSKLEEENDQLRRENAKLKKQNPDT